ncbi:ribosomal protection-like ABC-F family protein [Halioxenophilus aromaticivorans]|uniref:ATP-binding protein Uup n=1 Tax=Halioxenophilus aromaticivorans TaxID=1306992 RepID=A0AAV3TXJ1_9ALTE
MLLIKLDNGSLNYGSTILLEKQSLEITSDDRVCLIGRNGAGKSSLLKILAGDVELDDGSVWRKPGLKIARLEQDLPDADELTVYQSVALGLGTLGETIQHYVTLAKSVTTDAEMNRLAVLQQEIEAQDGWLIEQRIEAIMERLALDGERKMGELSGGWRRRVALARALVCDPDLLLLDEPTNHLDVETIQWLEEQLLDFRGAVLLITHDRTFLNSVANTIAELDRGHITKFAGNLDGFLEFKEAKLAEEARHNALFDKRLAEEEGWIRQGIKARRTRNEGRVRALKAMRVQRQERVERQGNANLNIQSGSNSGKLVAELSHIQHGFGDVPLIHDFSATILRGDRVGFIGPNGIGKSTLLKIILGQLQPQQGEVRIGTNLDIAYFDQMRGQLNLDETPVDNVAEGREFIEIDGQQRHVISYLGDFLFTGARARTPLKALSGGERNRVLLAKLFSKPCNLLVLDEPTNDLDVETLELLEEVLAGYQGTLLLVSHDRQFLDNVVTSTIAFEGNGLVAEYVGGYHDWLRQRPAVPSAKAKTDTRQAETTTLPKAQPESVTKKAKKLSYKLQRELEQLPGQIEALEASITELEAEMAAPEFYQEEHDKVSATLAQLSQAQQQLEEAMERWMELEAMAEG